MTIRRSCKPKTVLRLTTVGVATVALIATASGPATAESSLGSVAGPTSDVRIIEAVPLTQVAPLDPPRTSGDFGTFLEGGAFGPDGQFYFTRATAEHGQPKVMALDVNTLQTRTVHTDNTGTFSSTQFSPKNGLLYVTDFTGSIARMRPDGSDYTVLVSGEVLGSRMVADDLTFDREGNLYVTDFRGTPWEPTGRILRFDSDGHNPALVQGGLASPNGIAFNPEYSALWVSEYTASRLIYLPLGSDGKAGSGHVAVAADVGTSKLDSTAVDSAGNIYQALDGAGKMLVYRPDGTLAAEIVVPDAIERKLPYTTNLAIKPGTTEGYMVVGGHGGGWVYTFPSLAIGAEQSNGGGSDGRI